MRRASFYDLTIGKNIEFQRILAYAGLSVELVEMIIKDPSLANKMVDALPAAVPLYSPPSWYVEPKLQIQKVSDFLDLYCDDRNMTSLDIPPVPADFMPRTPTEVLLLTVFLPDKGRAKGVRRTFNSWWDFIIPPEGYVKYRWDGLKSDASHLRLASGIEHYPGIRWVVFDPNVNRCVPPTPYRIVLPEGTRFASAEVLMAAALFPEWVNSWDGGDSPYPNMAGYRNLQDELWQSSPCLYRWTARHQLMLVVNQIDYVDDGWSLPTVKEC